MLTSLVLLQTIGIVHVLKNSWESSAALTTPASRSRVTSQERVNASLTQRRHECASVTMASLATHAQWDRVASSPVVTQERVIVSSSATPRLFVTVLPLTKGTAAKHRKVPLSFITIKCLLNFNLRFPFIAFNIVFRIEGSVCAVYSSSADVYLPVRKCDVRRIHVTR